MAKDWDEVESSFINALVELRSIAEYPQVVPALTKKDKKKFAIRFQHFDSLLAQLRAFTNFEGKTLEDYGITPLEYEEYAAHYKNVLAELRDDTDEPENDLDIKKREAISVVVSEFADKWFLDEGAVQYAVDFHRNGEIPNSNILKDSMNYGKYKESVENPLQKIKCRSMMIAELKGIIETEIIPLQQR